MTTPKGENPDLTLHSLEFINLSTGWLVAEARSASPAPGAQVLRTSDGGTHWDKVAELKDTNVHRVEFVDPANGWAVAENRGPGDQAVTVKILRTRDGGKTWDVQWEEAAAGLPAGYDLWFQDATQGYALANGRLLSTDDGGQHWYPLSFGDEHFVPQHLSFVDFAAGWVIGVVGGEGRSQPPDDSPKNRLVVFRTTDGGQHWQQQFGRDYADGPVGSIDLEFVNATTGWFLTSNLATWAGDLYYTANGEDWEKINEIKCVRPTPRQVHFITAELGWIPLDVGAGPVAGGLLLTGDGGRSFQPVEGAGESVHEVFFVSPREGWAVGTAPDYGDYLVRTTDGGRTWTQVFP